MHLSLFSIFGFRVDMAKINRYSRNVPEDPPKRQPIWRELISSCAKFVRDERREFAKYVDDGEDGMSLLQVYLI